MFSEELERCKASGKLIEVYTDDRNTSKFVVGVVLYNDDDLFVLSCVSEFGKPDGFLMLETEQIVKIGEDSIYLKKIGALMRYHHERQERIEIEKYPEYTLLDHCRSNNRIAAVELLGSGRIDARGYVEELDIDKCVIRQIDDDGKNNGTAGILLKDISTISCCSNAEAMLEILSSELFDEMRSGS